VFVRYTNTTQAINPVTVCHRILHSVSKYWRTSFHRIIHIFSEQIFKNRNTSWRNTTRQHYDYEWAESTEEVNRLSEVTNFNLTRKRTKPFSRVNTVDVDDVTKMSAKLSEAILSQFVCIGHASARPCVFALPWCRPWRHQWPIPIAW